MVNQVALRRLRLVSLIEGVSTLLLFFVAMPLKYFADLPMAVTVMGSIHGVLFVGLVVMIGTGMSSIPLPVGLAIRCGIGAVIPFGPFVTDGWLKQLGARASEQSAS